MTDDAPVNVHRENRPPLDLAPVMVRIAERRASVKSPTLRPDLRAIVDADTDMLEAVTLECGRVRAANASLRDVIAKMQPR